MLRSLGKFVARLVDVYDINHWRSINREMRDTIEAQISRIRTISLVYNVCLELLQYDRTIYDEHWYKRQMISRKIKSERDRYLSIKVPVVTTCEIDLGDMILPQYVAEWRNMPDEYYVLLSVLEEFPSHLVTLLDSTVMHEIMQKQFKWLEQIILTMLDDTALDRILLFIPICSIIQEETTSYICYVNVIDTLLEDDFPMDQERFLVIDSLDKIDEMTNMIRTSDETQYIPRNIASNLVAFTKLLITHC